MDTKPDSTQMSLDRTWLAHERTLMAWVRTSASMISFGFTIYKFFQFENGESARAARAWLTPRDFALIIISIGMSSLWIATLQHRREIRYISSGSETRRRSLAELVAAVISVFGILALLAASFRR
jgi:putative membrane protein